MLPAEDLFCPVILAWPGQNYVAAALPFRQVHQVAPGPPLSRCQSE